VTDRATIEVLREHAWRFETSPAEEPGRILEPLERWSLDEIDAPETYPSGV
jgi:hypothetical protein